MRKNKKRTDFLANVGADAILSVTQFNVDVLGRIGAAGDVLRLAGEEGEEIVAPEGGDDEIAVGVLGLEDVHV